MFAKERQEKICALLEHRSSVTVSELTALFQVSIETVRRDLFTLEQQQCLKRVHGGAVSVGASHHMQQLEQRMEDHKEEKRELSLAAAGLIREGDIIAIDSGSTAAAFAQVLRERFHNLTVVTYSLDVFQILADSLHPILCGGEFFKQENCFYGDIPCQIMNEFHVSKSFLCPYAVSLEHGLSDDEPKLWQVQKTLLSIGDQTVILADSDKLETTALRKLSPLTDRMILVTDSHLPPEIERLYHEQGISLILPTDRRTGT